jgi:hypothetical protein
MTDFEVLGPMLIALSMSIGALCVLVWAVLSGALGEADKTAVNFLRAELGHDGGRRDDPTA